MESILGASEATRLRLFDPTGRPSRDDLALEPGIVWPPGAVFARLVLRTPRGPELLRRWSECGGSLPPRAADAVNDPGRPWLRRLTPAATSDAVGARSRPIDTSIVPHLPCRVALPQERATQLLLRGGIHLSLRLGEIEMRLAQRRHESGRAVSRRWGSRIAPTRRRPASLPGRMQPVHDLLRQLPMRLQLHGNPAPEVSVMIGRRSAARTRLCE